MLEPSSDLNLLLSGSRVDLVAICWGYVGDVLGMFRDDFGVILG